MVTVKSRFLTVNQPEIFKVYLTHDGADYDVCFFSHTSRDKVDACLAALERHGIDSIDSLKSAPSKVRKGFILAGCEW